MVIIDTCVWIDYFNGKHKDVVNFLVKQGMACVNDVILTEILPILKFRKQRESIELLSIIPNVSLDVSWNEVQETQLENLKLGINSVGPLDIIIAITATKHNYSIYTIDKHFSLMQKTLDFMLYDER